MSVKKRSLIVVIIVLVAITLTINIWYFALMLFGKQKIVSETYEVGLQKITDADGLTETRYFAEVNLMDDIFEIKFNYMLDESQSAFYSQGLQFMANKYGEIEFPLHLTSKDQELEDSSGWWFWEKKTYKRYLVGNNSKIEEDNYNFRNYMSSDDYKTCLDSTNRISTDSLFKIQLDDKLYGMKFKGTSIGFNDFNDLKYIDAYVKSWKFNTWGSHVYYSGDVINMAKLIYDGMQTLPNGTNQACIFEFADMFDYYEYNEEDSVYEKESIADEELVKIIKKEVKSYYSILVHKSEGKIQKASESIFNCVAGNPGYNISGDIESEDYFVGRTTIDTTIYNFDLVLVSGNSYALKLNDKFISKYEDLSDVIVLDILIDLDYFNSLGYEFVGFTLDNNLDKFKVLQCRTAETIDGEIVYTGVAYA